MVALGPNPSVVCLNKPTSNTGAQKVGGGVVRDHESNRASVGRGQRGLLFGRHLTVVDRPKKKLCRLLVAHFDTGRSWSIHKQAQFGDGCPRDRKKTRPVRRVLDRMASISFET